MSDEVTIITNHGPRDIIDAWELSEKERKEFDYIDWQKIEKGEDSASFVRYKGELYDLGDFMPVGELSLLQGWDEYISDTFFSGILVKYVHAAYGEMSVVMGRYYS